MVCNEMTKESGMALYSAKIRLSTEKYSIDVKKMSHIS